MRSASASERPVEDLLHAPLSPSRRRDEFMWGGMTGNSARSASSSTQSNQLLHRPLWPVGGEQQQQDRYVPSTSTSARTGYYDGANDYYQGGTRTTADGAIIGAIERYAYETRREIDLEKQDLNRMAYRFHTLKSAIVERSKSRENSQEQHQQRNRAGAGGGGMPLQAPAPSPLKSKGWAALRGNVVGKGGGGGGGGLMAPAPTPASKKNPLAIYAPAFRPPQRQLPPPTPSDAGGATASPTSSKNKSGGGGDGGDDKTEQQDDDDEEDEETGAKKKLVLDDNGDVVIDSPFHPKSKSSRSSSSSSKSPVAVTAKKNNKDNDDEESAETTSLSSTADPAAAGLASPPPRKNNNHQQDDEAHHASPESMTAFAEVTTDPSGTETIDMSACAEGLVRYALQKHELYQQEIGDGEEVDNDGTNRPQEMKKKKQRNVIEHVAKFHPLLRSRSKSRSSERAASIRSASVGSGGGVVAAPSTFEELMLVSYNDKNKNNNNTHQHEDGNNGQQDSDLLANRAVSAGLHAAEYELLLRDCRDAMERCWYTTLRHMSARFLTEHKCVARILKELHKRLLRDAMKKNGGM